MNATTCATKGESKKGKKSAAAILACLLGMMPLASAPAAPIFDDSLVPYPYDWNIFNDSGASVFINGTPTLTVFNNGNNGGVSIFSWNATKAPAINSYSAAGSAGISLSAADSQFVLVLNGINAVTPDGYNQASLLIMPLFGNTPGVLAGYGGGYITVTPDINGSWAFDMRGLAEATYGVGNMPSLWAVQIAIDTFGQEDTGYSFESFAAVPEPSTVAFLALAGVGCAIFFRRKLTASAQ